MYLKLISCEVFFREMCHTVAQSPHTIDVEFLPKGLHDLGAVPMRERLQEIVDAQEGKGYEALIFGYGLCNNGLAGLTARTVPIVLPRAHDCITLFLGSRKRYADYFQANPGVYFETSGWIERGSVKGDLTQLSIQRKTGMDRSYAELVEKYGEENAAYLYETLCQYTHNYGQYTFIEMGIEPDDGFEKRTREMASEKGWKFAKERGDMALIERLIGGDWNPEEFLTVPPGGRVRASYDEGVVGVEEA